MTSEEKSQVNAFDQYRFAQKNKINKMIQRNTKQMPFFRERGI